jgi:hypothetical protein
MALHRYGLLLIAAAGVWGQTDVTGTATTETTETSESATLTENATPTGSYLTYASQETQDVSRFGTVSSLASSMAGNFSQSSVSTTSDSRTVLVGSAATGTNSGNFSTAASSAATPTVTNTRPCNNYAEFCNRKYSNITEIGCHNSPFVTTNNVAANQLYDVTAQLNDGVRFLQAQVQWPTNGTEPHFCHTSCDILDAGPITEWLTKVKTWVSSHPYDIVTILLGNGN